MKIKICGLKFESNILDLSKLEPDYMGFIFWEKSKRLVTGSSPNLSQTKIKKTGVFVNADFEKIKDKVHVHKLEAIQLHGQESPEFCKKIKNLGVEIIKTFSIDENFNFNILEKYKLCSDYFLFDTKGKSPGGNGISFDWEILRNYNYEKKFFLSGGIGIESINAIKKIKNLDLPLFGVDINSKFEINPGKKNVELIKSFKRSLDNEI
ncbi:MAG: N-(5'-phosphoribosyl)anthranilate isomerase [Flavobacteriaceae bacterium]|nr:N-(5'-phosphoribosyl)anthranilate isomerase [Flavobacteriaceae bacterium]|tara:strand:- start:242 stop:865 length:624 start_codon:yes stop_codon:yes gene_type:complete